MLWPFSAFLDQARGAISKDFSTLSPSQVEAIVPMNARERMLVCGGFGSGVANYPELNTQPRLELPSGIGCFLDYYCR